MDEGAGRAHEVESVGGEAQACSECSEGLIGRHSREGLLREPRPVVDGYGLRAVEGARMRRGR